MFILRLRHALNLDQRGAVVIEFAIVVLLLLLILFGILEFSFTFLQRHFVANAAREGVRIGVRAQNYNCFDATDPSFSCQNTPLSNQVYRKGTVIEQLSKCDTNPKGYLCTLYPSDKAQVVVVSNEDSGANTKTLTVTVEASNFFPPLLSGLVPGYKYNDKIKYSAIGNYENADEH
jgi:Flp pilus assembly protein TadG